MRSSSKCRFESTLNKSSQHSWLESKTHNMSDTSRKVVNLTEDVFAILQVMYWLTGRQSMSSNLSLPQRKINLKKKYFDFKQSSGKNSLLFNSFTSNYCILILAKTLRFKKKKLECQACKICRLMSMPNCGLPNLCLQRGFYPH